MSDRHKLGCGCIKGFLTGCLLIFLIFAGLIIAVFSLANLELPGSVVEKKYYVAYENTPGEKKIEREFTWKYVDNNLNRIKPTINFSIPEKDVKEAMLFLQKLARSSYESIGLGNIESITDSILIAREIWEAVYRQVYINSDKAMYKIAARFSRIFKDERMQPADKLLFLSSFIQNIDYKIPEDEFGLIPPLVVLSRKYGDCDTKALLLYTLLKKNNVDCVIFWSGYYAHAMLGVVINTTGDYLIYKGKKYYFLETTRPNWAPGQLPPEVAAKSHWYVTDPEAARQDA